MVVFCAVVNVFYKLSVVNFIIQRPDLLVDENLQLKTEGLKNFAVVKSAASETVFKYAIRCDEIMGGLFGFGSVHSIKSSIY